MVKFRDYGQKKIYICTAIPKPFTNVWASKNE